MVTSSTASRVGAEHERAPGATDRRGAARPDRSEASLGTLSHALLQLQRTTGNRAVEALLRPSSANVSCRAPGPPLAIVQRAVESRGPATRIQRQGPYDQPN